MTNLNEELEPGFFAVARELTNDINYTAALLFGTSQAMSARRIADALERIADRLDEVKL